MMMNYRILKIAFLTLWLCLAFNTAAFATSDRNLQGIVVSKSGEPLVGVSVILQRDSQVISGVATDTLGRFIFNPASIPSGDYHLKFSAIGYKDTSVSLSSISNATNPMAITLIEMPIEIERIIVNPQVKLHERSLDLPREQLARETRRSLIATNPIGAIRVPEVTHVGSYHSSRLKINGINPVYYINGMEMGQNPDHYGMFSILPGPVIENLSLSTSGNDASYGSPSMIEFSTVRPFSQKPKSEIDLSFIEGTGSIFMGDDRFFFLSSMRKSILDRLADRLNSGSSGRSIPPTNFRDIYLSSGVKSSPNSTLLVDSYITSDYLAYDLNGTQLNPDGISTVQGTGDRYLSLRFERVKGNAYIKLGAAAKDNTENYAARSIEDRSQETFHVDLNSHERIYLANGSIDYQLNKTSLKFGGSLKYYADKYLSMNQTNWNFLPPDAASDIPYIYQRELNRFYGSYENTSTQLSNSAYLTLTQKIANYEFQTGGRIEHFAYLAEKIKPVYRLSLARKSQRIGNISLSYGTYAASPVSRTLEPYQILIDANLEGLTPVETRLLSAKYEIGPLTLGAFRQYVDKSPRIAPDFSKIAEHNIPDSGFIAMKSDGKINTAGYEIGLNFTNLFSHKLDFRAYYAYGKSEKTTFGVTVPYELSSPHRLFAEINYNLTRNFSLGGDFSSHSGYRYSTIPFSIIPRDHNIYTPDVYRAAMGAENSHQFNFNMIANVCAELDWGRCQIFGVVSNITNHKNSIIKTADGFIYDASLIPSIGLKYQF
jgi:hypothetical protein